MAVILDVTVGHVHDGRPGVYIGRPARAAANRTSPEVWRWGNPFEVGISGARGECVKKFSLWLSSDPDPRAEWMRQHIEELRGKHLKCFCRYPGQDEPACHGDVFRALLYASRISQEIKRREHGDEQA